MLDWEKITKQLAAVRAAPAPFVVALLVAAVLVWLALDWRYSGILANRDSEISSLKGQRDEYREKLGGASPDQAKARVDALEARLAAIEPRRLSSAQKTELLADLKSVSGFILITSDMGCADCGVFASDLKEIAERANWKIITAFTMFGSPVSPKGLVVIIPDAQRPSPGAAALIAGLKRLNIPHDVKSGAAVRTFPGQKDPDLELLLTNRAST